MPASKTNTAKQSGLTMTAGAGDVTQAVHVMTTAYGGLAMVKLTNGATGPTLAAQCQLVFSGDDATYFKQAGPLVGNTDNNGVESWAVPIPVGVRNIEFITGSNTDEDVVAILHVTNVDTI